MQRSQVRALQDEGAITRDAAVKALGSLSDKGDILGASRIPHRDLFWGCGSPCHRRSAHSRVAGQKCL